MGGSNISFSYSTESLSDYTPHTAFNFGTHAGLDLPFILDLVQAEARPGDTIVLALEYENFGYNGKYSAVKLDYICGCNPDYLRGLSVLERARIVFSFNLLALTEPNLSLHRRAMQMSQPIGPVRRGPEVPYLSAHEDDISHARERQTDADLRGVFENGPTDLAFDGREDSWRVLAAFLGRIAGTRNSCLADLARDAGFRLLRFARGANGVYADYEILREARSDHFGNAGRLHVSF